MTPQNMREGIEYLDACLRELHQDADGNLRVLDDDEQKRFDDGLAERARLLAQLERHDRVAKLAAVPANLERGADSFEFKRTVEVPELGQVRSLSRAQARDAALKRLEVEREVGTDDERGAVDALLHKPQTRNFDPDIVARRLLVTETAAYRSAFTKAFAANGSAPAWDVDEARAMSEFRAMSTTDAAGGFGIPVLIDPSIILTSGAVDAPILGVCRIETITTDEWKGVSSLPAAWSTDGEATAVSDDAVTLAQPTVPTYRGAAFIPYSIEVGINYPGFANEMSELIRQGYVDYLASKTSSGSGSSDITGIWTALDANTNVEVTPTTDGAFGAVDIDKVWKELKKRFRTSAHWLMNVDVENEIRAFGSGTATSRFTVDQTMEGISRLNGKPVLIDEYAPEFTGTTGASNILIIGDFRNYLVARRLGMTVEFVPHLFDVTSNRPTGQRGWYAYAFTGGDAVNDLGFRLLQNQ